MFPSLSLSLSLSALAKRTALIASDLVDQGYGEDLFKMRPVEF